MERSFRRDMAALQNVFDFMETCMSTYRADRDSASAIALAVEELFTNIIRHARGGRQDIIIGVTRNGNTLVVTMVDTDVEPFDITNAAEVDTSLPLERRRIGGLGIHLVKQLVENLTYSYSDGRSTISFSKTLET